jgi:hypothetical protein
MGNLFHASIIKDAMCKKLCVNFVEWMFNTENSADKMSERRYVHPSNLQKVASIHLKGSVSDSLDPPPRFSASSQAGTPTVEM